MTYLLTFACYRSHLPGEEGSIDRYRNLPGSRLTPPNPALLRATQMAMRQVPYEMHAATRRIVLQIVREVCDHKSWRLLAAHVRTNHVHIVMEADVKPEVALNAFKAYASRALNRVSTFERGRLRRARHGSTRYLWTRDQIDAAVRYVLDKQGDPMAVWQAPPRSAP